MLRTNRNKGISLRAAWRCPRCFYVASWARKHRCYKKMKAIDRRVKTLKQLRKQAHKYVHGIDAELLRRTFETAIRMVSGEALDQ